jgi:hypothetical protein
MYNVYDRFETCTDLVLTDMYAGKILKKLFFDDIFLLVKSGEFVFSSTIFVTFVLGHFVFYFLFIFAFIEHTYNFYVYITHQVPLLFS